MSRTLQILAAITFVTTSAPSALAEKKTLSEAEIKQVVARHAHEVKRCYTRHALKQSSARGKVTVAMVVTADGGVKDKSVNVQAPGVRGRKFDRCVRRRVRAWRFPKSSFATDVQFPFLFQHARGYR